VPVRFRKCVLRDDANFCLNGTMGDSSSPMAAEMPDIVLDQVETPGIDRLATKVAAKVAIGAWLCVGCGK